MVHTRIKTKRNEKIHIDIRQWNFILFLTLSFILLVIVAVQMKTTNFDLRSKAGLECPKLVAPEADACPGGWTYKRDTNGCVAFFCEEK